MKIGLLVCDHVRPDYVEEFGTYPQMFRRLFPNLNFVDYFVVDGQFPIEVNECDAYIITGSKYAAYDKEDWILMLKEFIMEIYESGRKYAGICFGHQMLAESLGGKVEKAKVGWGIGVHTFGITKKANWMKPDLASINLLLLCQDQVVELPPTSTVYASSDFCPVAMFTVGENMLGIQAHPEFTKAYDKRIMYDRLDRMGKETVEKAVESLVLDTDHEVVAKWVVQFLDRS